jgi:predicted ArsR family transcriptional regulator
MDGQTLDVQIADLASSLGDATRRGIYITVRESPEAVTANQIAALFDIHPNVARHHLDRLVDDGYLSVAKRRPEGRTGPGAGRPANHYTATSKEVSVQFPARRYDLLSELLVRVIEEIAPDNAGAIAERVGREYGRELAGEIGMPTDAGFEVAAQAVARAMMGVGFDTEAHVDERLLVTSFCPFGTTATNHPEIVCKLDQGIVRGLMESANASAQAVVMPHSTEEQDCVTEV